MLAEELVEQWPRRWPRPTIGSTKNATSQIKPFGAEFAGRNIRSITREEFRRWALQHPGNARYVRTMLYDALDAGLVDENVAAGVKIPKPRTKRPAPPSEHEVERLVEWARGVDEHIFAAAIHLAAYCGLREGELRALRSEDLVYGKPDVDYPTRIIVRHSMNRLEELVEPKTDSSATSCAVLGLARFAFMHRATEAHFLFPFTRARRQGLWDEARKATGVKCRWHDLRHFCATWLLDRGATVDDVALQLRCSVDEVRRCYGHPDREQALGRLEAIAGG